MELLEMLDAVARAESMYMSSLSPAPQYSELLPGHTKLQSPGAARTDPGPNLLPQ